MTMKNDLAMIVARLLHADIPFQIKLTKSEVYIDTDAARLEFTYRNHLLSRAGPRPMDMRRRRNNV